MTDIASAAFETAAPLRPEFGPTAFEKLLAKLPSVPAEWHDCITGKRYKYLDANGKEVTDIVVECAQCKRRAFRKDGDMTCLTYGPISNIYSVYLCTNEPPVPGVRVSKCYDAFVRSIVRTPFSIDLTVPAQYADAHLGALEPKLKALAHWPEKTPFVSILGPTGCGKTYACWAIVRELARRGRPVRFETCTELAERWFPEATRARVERGLYETPLLILDEFSSPEAKYGKQVWSEACHRILSARIENKLPTLIAAHDKIEQMMTKFTTAVISRLHQFAPLVPTARDRRMKT